MSDLVPPEPRSRGRYSAEEIERGLAELAVCSGSAKSAARELEAKGLKIPASTLEGWKRTHADRYAVVRLEVVPRIHSKMAEECEDLAIEYGQVEREIIERFREELPNLKAGEAANAMRNAATSKAIAVDKASLLRGKPTSRVEHRGVEETIRKLVGQGVIEVEYDVDGTAEELPPAA